MKQKDLLMYAGIGVGAYFLWTRFIQPAMLPVGSPATPAEQLASTAATIAGQFNAMTQPLGRMK